MRFAYIDSQGKEVGIPSVDALQLRVELGAIGEETMFFDARSGKWARAGEHEIFRTLVREVREAREEKPFAAAGAPERSGGTVGEEAGIEIEEAGIEIEEAGIEAAGIEQAPGEQVPDEEAPDEEVPDEESGEFDAFDLSALEPNDVDAPGDGDGTAPPLEWGTMPMQGVPEDEVGEDELFLGGSELQLEETGEDGSRSPPGWFEAGPENDGLQLEEAWKAGASSAAAPGPTDPGPTDPGATEPAGPAAEADASAAAANANAPADADASAPATAADADALTPAADADAAAAADPPAADGSGSKAQEPPPAPSPGTSRTPAARRPSSRRGRSGSGRRIAAAAILVLAGAGGWFGWSLLRGDPGTEEMEAAVVVPDLPPELEELHARAVPGAVEALVEALRQDAASLPEAPDGDWLGGEYLAAADAFPDVEAYWTSLGGYLRGVREREAEVFAEAYARELEGLPVPGPTSRERLVERAAAAFRAARADRADAYDRLDTLVTASLDLHEFLEANEERITYEPTAGGFSRDPVTEAIPATPELGDEIWSRVSRITAAMDALGTVDRLTTQGLVDFVLRRVAQAPVR